MVAKQIDPNCRQTIIGYLSVSTTIAGSINSMHRYPAFIVPAG
jgi:hypothetical protein